MASAYGRRTERLTMQAAIFIGIQASGKTEFYRRRFFDTHVRINLDMLKTRHREAVLLRACLEAKQPFVVDNTNPTVDERAKYISAAREAGFRVVGYFFQSKLAQSLERNEQRALSQRVPRVGVLGTFNRLQLPSLAEGFDALFFVSLRPPADFSVEEWRS